MQHINTFIALIKQNQTGNQTKKVTIYIMDDIIDDNEYVCIYICEV